MIRAVVDTNVFVSSFFGGKPRAVIDAWKSGKFTLCLSGPVIDEYVEVLSRLGLADEPELDELLKLFASGFNSVFSARTPKLRIVRRDSDDDMFVECAVALQADSIVSGDKALLAVAEYAGISIVTPARFVAGLRD